MTNQRRSGFRLPWAGAEQETDAAAAGEQQSDVTEAAATAEQPAKPAAASTETTDASPVESTPATAAAEPKAAAASATAAQPATPAAPNPFLRSLVDAMRGVAEEARTTSLTELKAKVEQRVEHLGASGAELAEDLRRQSELDIKGIGDWERGEVERIRGEAARKVEARRQQLEQQLVERQQLTEREIEATRSQLSDYERELAAFVAELAEIEDPAVFVETARRMPRQPSLEVTHAAGTKAAASETPHEEQTLSERLARLGVGGKAAQAGEAATVATTTPTAATRTPTGATTSSNGQGPTTDEATDTNATTAIVVKGLGSFGAITSFKQSLEKSVGIRAVSLSLGPTGEFVYRASHDPSFDIEAAIREAESGAASIERQPDGTVRVNVVRAR